MMWMMMMEMDDDCDHDHDHGDDGDDGENARPDHQDDWMMIKTGRIMLRRRIDDRND